jgi:hypothetical protein
MTAASIIHSGHAACFICLLLFTSGTCSAGWLSRLAGDKEAEWRAARDTQRKNRSK